LTWPDGSATVTQHFALNDYHEHRRHMQRITVAGDRPV